jgi:hypothetical protein
MHEHQQCNSSCCCDPGAAAATEQQLQLQQQQLQPRAGFGAFVPYVLGPIRKKLDDWSPNYYY